MRTHVTFQADFSKDASPTQPAGRDLAQYLASQVEAAGFPTSTPKAHEGYAYTFACRRAQHTFVVFVGLVDDGVQEWLVFAEPKMGGITRWLRKVGIGRSRNPESPALHELCTTIHQSLHVDPRFRAVRWYTAEGWDTSPDAGWTRVP